MHLSDFISLPLADVDVVKVVFGVIVAVLWIAAQIGSSMAASKKKQEAQRRVALQLPPTAQVPPQSVSTPPLQRSAPPIRQPMPQPVRAPAPPMRQQAPQSMRRPLPQQMRQSSPPTWEARLPQEAPRPHARSHPVEQPAARPKSQPRQPALAARGAERPPVASKLPAAAAGVAKGEIGGKAEASTRAPASEQAIEKVRQLLGPRSVREIIIAAELLRPPVALRRK